MVARLPIFGNPVTNFGNPVTKFGLVTSAPATRAERQLKITLNDIIAKGKSIKEEFTVKRERAPRVYYPRSLKLFNKI